MSARRMNTLKINSGSESELALYGKASPKIRREDGEMMGNTKQQSGTRHPFCSDNFLEPQ